MAVLATGGEIEAAVQRSKLANVPLAAEWKAKAAADAAKEAAKQEELRVSVCKELGDSAVMVEGHPHEECNGVYKHDSEYKGWPVLKNAHGMYCSRYRLEDEWVLS